MSLFQLWSKKIEGNDHVISVKIVGEKDKKSEKLYANTKKAAKRAGLEADVLLVTDPAEYEAYELKSLPALLVNDEVISSGRALSVAEAEALLNSNWAI